MSESRPANRLARETSPYLRQHAHNPVDWFPWGPEAFAAARRDDRPLLLSVGYSACHWCHVMERESFEDDRIAGLMNSLFVNVKVDREERPDVDQIYMQAVQALSGRGGWPMTVFLTPDGVPFYGGTYYPPVDRHGMPGFPRVLEAVAEAYRARRGDIAETGRQLLEHMRQSERLRASATVLGPDILTGAYQGIAGEYDERWGGTGGAPKFPQPMIWEFLLRYWRRTGQPRALEMARATMVRMARGGIYDQIGGGFHRYSVDGEWLVPHFEKMLYDNAQLASLYLHGWLATGDTELKRVCQQTLDYLLREMRHPEGGFFSATDADSEGEEGKFFVWTPDELHAAVGDDALAQVAAVYWGVADGPNFEGASILHVPREPAEVAAALGLDEPALAVKLGEAGRQMYEARRRRVPPGLDDKVLAGWNGLALIALAEAGRALGRDDYLDAAAANAAFLTGAMRPDGRLRRSWKDGSAPISAYLEDHAMVGLGLLACYEGRFERRWLDASASLAEDALRLFWDAGQECFFDTGADQEALVVRPRNLFDNAVPSGTSMAIEWLLRLAQHLGSERHRTIALTALRPLADLMAKYPSGLARYLGALDLHLGPVHEVALVWPGSAALALDDAVAREVFGRFRPNQVVAGSAEGDPAAAGLPLLEGRRALAGRLTAYVCRDYVCDRPTADAAELRSQLEV